MSRRLKTDVNIDQVPLVSSTQWIPMDQFWENLTEFKTLEQLDKPFSKIVKVAARKS